MRGGGGTTLQKKHSVEGSFNRKKEHEHKNQEDLGVNEDCRGERMPAAAKKGEILKGGHKSKWQRREGNSWGED